MFTRIRIAWIGVVTGACVLLVGSLSLAKTTGMERAGTRIVPLARVIHDASIAVKQSTYPEIVARVNGRPIYGKDLTMREIVVMNASTANNDVGLTQLALDQLIREEALLQVAADMGVTVSDNEVIAEIQSIQQDVEKYGDQAAKEGLAEYARLFDISPEQLTKDPRVIAEYRRGDILGKMRQKIVYKLPVDQRNDPEAIDNAIQQFVAQAKAHIEILVSK